MKVIDFYSGKKTDVEPIRLAFTFGDRNYYLTNAIIAGEINKKYFCVREEETCLSVTRQPYRTQKEAISAARKRLHKFGKRKIEKAVQACLATYR